MVRRCHPTLQRLGARQEYLRGGELATEATLGKGKLALIGLEATFRATPQGTFKLLFNGVYSGPAFRRWGSELRTA